MLTRRSFFRPAAIFVAALVLAATAYADGTLFFGTDAEEFNGVTPDRLGKAPTIGAVMGPVSIIPLHYPLNGIVNGGGFLYAGDPGVFAGVPVPGMLRTIDYNGNLLTAIPAGLPSGCCNEEMLVAMGSEVVGTGTLFHAHYPTNIQLINPATGAVVISYPQNDVIGMARVGSDIWISKWGPRLVGKWNPATNTFTPVFSTLTNAGGLAYDAGSGVLWVGRQGGSVGPHNLTGALLGPEVQPFGPIDDTIDGLELVCAPNVTGAAANPGVLWPPNHKMADVTLTYATASCAPTRCTVNVSSNEPVNAQGDGNTAPDWEVVDATHVKLRAERSGSGSGRIYTITVMCTDQLGQTSQATAMVTVPHDKGM